MPATVAQLCARSFADSRQHEQCEQNSLQPEFAPVAVEPFLQGVSTAPGTAAADGNGFATQRQGNIGVGRSSLYLGHIAQVGIDGAYHLQQTCIRVQLSGRTIANHHHFAGDGMRFALRRGAMVGGALFGFDRLIQTHAQGTFQPLEFGSRGRTQIHAHAGRLGNGIDGSAPTNDTDVEGALGRRGDGRLAEVLDGAGEDDDRVGRAEIAPGVTTGTAHDDFEAPAAQGLGNDGVGASAVENQAVGDRVFPARSSKDVAHTAQIALALLTDVADEQKWHGMADTDGAEEGGHASPVVRNTGAVEASSLLADVERSAGRKNRVDVCAQRDVPLSESRVNAEDVAYVIDPNVVESDLMEALR